MSLPTPPNELEDTVSPTPPPTPPQLPITPPLTPEPSLCTTDYGHELVIAHYNEDLTWLFPHAQRCTIYSKGYPASMWLSSSKAHQPQFKSLQQLPNIGRETHTYLTHIVRNYHNLAPITFFLQGDIHHTNNGTPAHTNLSLTDLINTTSKLSSTTDILPIGREHTFSDWSSLKYKPSWMLRRGQTMTRSKLTPHDFWYYIFEEDPPESIPWVQGALYAVTANAIQKRPRRFYQRLLRYFDNLNERNPEEGHYMERFWWSIFDVDVAVNGV